MKRKRETENRPRWFTVALASSPLRGLAGLSFFVHLDHCIGEASLESGGVGVVDDDDERFAIGFGDSPHGSHTENIVWSTKRMSSEERPRWWSGKTTA